ncbi:hypothetical protein MMC07_007976 [Pseudocyphellaria aurata]|nr:hypothetical protein [Pseudocyphellaria aurata]
MSRARPISDLVTNRTPAVTPARSIIEPFTLLGKLGPVDRVLDEVQGQITTAVKIVDVYPCTPLQEGLLAISLKQKGKFLVQNPYKLPATFDREKFQAAWQTTVDSNAILRTRIVQTRSFGLLQVVLEHQRVEWLIADDLAEYLENDRRAPIGVGLALHRQAIIDDVVSGSKYFVLTSHHAILDGWSMRLFLKQVDSAYRQMKVYELENFNQFISYLINIDQNVAESFWRKQLANIAAIQFPSLLSATYLPLANCSLERHIEIPKTLASVATTSTIIQAAWALLIGKLTNTNDVVFGLVLAGRNVPVPNIMTISGPTFTTVPMRVVIDLQSSVSEYLVAIQKQKSEMKPYQHAGLQTIRRLGIDGSTACEFQNLLVIQPQVERDPENLFDARETVVDHWAKLNAYGLLLQCDITQAGFKAMASFDTQMVSEKQVGRALAQLQHILLQLASRLTDRIGDFDILDLQDKQDISARNAEFEVVQSCLHEMIEERSYHCPTSLAISSWDGELTYHQLDVLSLRLAHRLRISQIGPEVRVALVFEKTLWMVVSMVAVMKAGGVFVPLDPTHPKKRLESIIREVGAGLLLCSEQCFDIVSGISNETIIVNLASLEQLPLRDSPACSTVTPQNAIYIMFTSGSTGKPKGCVLEHVACCSSVAQLTKSFGITAKSRVLQFSSYSFDGCILEILATLTVGGCVCIPSDADRLNNLVATMRKMRINWAFLTPAVGRLIDPESVPELKALALGGEKLGQEDLDRWIGRLRLFECYGPTECCVICVVNHVTEKGSKPSIIGSGIIGTFVVVNDANHLVPVGTVGELLIGGPNLARDYFNDRVRTAGSFLDSPTWLPQLDIACKRFYRTGDLVKFEQDGSIDFVGRKDAQVKLRGQRIEMGEVEHHLRRNLDGVVDVAAEVIHPENDCQNPFLAAFVSLEDCLRRTEELKSNGWIAHESSLLTKTAELSIRLSTSLPRYMIPSVFIPMRAIPLTTSGKIDRRQLQDVIAGLTMEELARFHGEQQEKKVPSTENEKRMHRLWVEILALGPNMIGTNDSFVQLGGDSILAMKLVAAAHGEGLLLTVADVFRTPVLSELATVVAEIGNVDNSDATEILPFALVDGSVSVESLCQEAISQCNLAADSIEDLYPCTPFQEGVMVLSVRQSGAYVAQHVFDLRAALTLDVGAFCAAWETVVESNPILRTRIIQTGSAGLMQVVVKERMSWLLESDFDAYVRRDKEIPMGFGTPLIRYAIITPTTEQNNKRYFVWTTHHAIYDGYSLQLTLNHVSQTYQDLKAARRLDRDTPKPSNPSIAFHRFIKNLQDLDSSKAQNFWIEQFCDGGPSTFPPLRSPYLSRPSASVKFEVKFYRKLHSDITSSTIIRVAWAMLIGKYASSNDVVFGSTLSGRTGSIAHTEKTMGPTVTTVPIRIKIDPSKKIVDFLRLVQKQTLDMVSFAHMGISNIRRINVRTKLACDFHNLLVIQPREDSIVDETFLCRQGQNLTNFDTYPLTLDCQLTRDGLIATAIFDAEVIDNSQMIRMLAQFQHIVQQLCLEQNDKIVEDIETISPEDVQELWTWNATVPQAAESCVQHLIEQVMHEAPYAPAVCSHDGDLTYSELNNLSSRLANHLVGKGVGVESKVPIFFEKSKWAVVAILGIIKAGGAFVPLDPSHPKMRLMSIFHQVDAKVLLCSAEHAQVCSILFPQGSSIVVNSPEVAGLSDDKSTPSVEVRPSDAVYVIFTSGTTGTPKGTVVEHGAYCSGARDHAKALLFDRTSRHLQFASYSFDTSVEDILTTLLVGGCLCIPSEEERRCDIVGAIKRMHVTAADLTPSFVSHMAPNDVQSLTTLILGGERLTSKIIQTWANRLRLINAYGTTECCVTNFVNSKITPETDPANIGLAVGGIGWIVETNNPNRLAPIGTIGELLIEGPTLARGYLNDETKTNAVFTENPAWARDDRESRRPRRLYMTGDLAQYNTDGTINYIGRKDTRVKIRGQRIELDEVEHHLVSHPQVKSAMAAIPDLGPRKDCLAAIIQFRSTTDPLKHQDMKIAKRFQLEQQGVTWSDLSIYLSDRIPAYMIPTTWIAIESMPLHTSGKLDRSKLNSWLASLPVEQSEAGEYKDEGPDPLAADELIALGISRKVADLVSNDSSSLHAAIAGYDVTLSKFGMDSIRITTLAAFIKQSYGIVVGFQKLIGNRTTIRDIAKQILEANAGTYREPSFHLDLMKEISMLDTQLGAVQPVRAQLKTVFVTGATGYLGTQLLKQLLVEPNVEKVIAHVRADSFEHGRQRIITSAKIAKWWSERLSPKLEIWIGDLAQPRIGLSLQQWKHLSRVDAVIHNGASVQWNADYHALKAVNVMSTVELLTPTGESSPPPKFVYVSGGRDFGNEFSDSEIAAKLAPLEGYSQTKFVSEILVKQHAQRWKKRAKTSILKPGLIIGTAREGIANVDDFLWRLAAGAVSIKKYPEQATDSWLPVSSTERVAEVLIGSLLDEPDESGSIIEISDGVTLQDFWNILNAQLKYELQPLEYSQWKKLLLEDIENRKESHPMWPVLHLLDSVDKIGTKKPRNGISQAASDAVKAAIEKNVTFLIDIGFLSRDSMGANSTLAFKRSQINVGRPATKHSLDVQA